MSLVIICNYNNNNNSTYYVKSLLSRMLGFKREREREREGKRGEEASFTKLCHLEPTMFCFVPALSLSVSGEL